MSSLQIFLIFAFGTLFLAVAHTTPVHREVADLSSLGSRITSKALPHLQSAASDPRLPLPTPQEIEAIKKVAQILIMLGEQVLNRVIPSIIGDSASGSTSYFDTVEESSQK